MASLAGLRAWITRPGEAARVSAERKALNEQRKNLQLVAPVDGLVSLRNADPGTTIVAGQAVVELLDLSAIEVEFGVTDREVVALQVGDPVSLRVDVFPEEWFDGTIAQVGYAADERTRKYPVQARVPNPDGRLLASMLGTIRFSVGDSSPAIWIPGRALQREFELDYLFVLEGDSGTAVVRRRRVKTRPVPFRPDLIEVVEGLNNPERIAVSGVRELREGQRVRIVGDGS
jgi:RND family efflux transporter MFP subunit